ncbi:MAG: MCE family protein [Gammaproteobacteria bacterium]|nr:MCE family protein [Gammaproteobacteria bacterium]
MHDRAYAIATGAFVVAALAVLFVTAYWLAGADPERRPYEIVSRYSVAGLSEGSEVLYRGVPAGRVERIRIDPADPAQVLIRIAVNPQIPVQRTTVARLHQRGLTGIAQIELEDEDHSSEPLPTRDEDPARIPMASSLLDEVTDAGTQALTMLSELAENLNETLDEQNRAQLRSVLTRVDRMLGSVEQVTEALQAELPRTLDNASRAADSVATLADRTTESMDEVDALIAELRETAAVARRLGEELSGSGVSGLDRALAAVDEAARDMARLARELAQQPQRLLQGRQTAPGPGEE